MTYTLVKRPQPAKKEQQPETKKPNPKRNRPAPANTAEPSPTTVFPGSLDDIAPLASVRIQAKLSVGSPDDPHEQEADHIAAKVVSEMESTSSEPSRPSPSLPDERLVQRKCTTPAATFDGSPKFSERLQRARAQGGQPLAPTIRAAMERGFGADFTAVQIHHDEQAASLAQQIGARAFTVGSDVFFNRGEHRPAMRAGRELLAHELSHVLQQRTSGETLDRKRKLAPSFETAKPGQLGYRIALAEGSEFGEPGVASGPPLGHSFEIVDGRLIATLRTPVDIHGVQQLLEIINAKELDPSRRGPPFIPPPVGLPFFIVKLDITSFLPTTIRKFMVDHGDFLRHTREFSKLEEPPAEDDGKARAVWEGLFDTYAKMRDDPINRSMGNAAVLTKAKKSSTRIPKEGLRQAWNANCHEFAALLFRSAHPDDPSKTLSDFKELRTTRPLTVSEVRVGDLVMLFAHGLDDPEIKAKGGLSHTALIIRVAAPREDMIEVLEKQNPVTMMSTRTVAEIRDSYERERPGTGVAIEIRYYRHPSPGTDSKQPSPPTQ